MIQVVVGLIPDVLGVGGSRVSLPNLLELNSVYDLESDWSLNNNIKLDTGRLLIGKLGGSLWSESALPNSDEEWTVELVFRSTGTGRDITFGEKNGLSLFLANNPNVNDVSNFGGPSKFDGFQFLFNNKEKEGLKIFANDNLKTIGKNLGDSIGNCEFTYLDSTVPFTLRVSYSKAKNWFKVQIDNNLCFKTDQISIPRNNFKLGISGDNNPASEEIFEVLKLNVWDHLTDDAIDDHGLMADGQIKVAVTKVQEPQQKPQQDSEFHPPSKIRQSLMERTSRHKELLLEQEKAQMLASNVDNSKLQEIVSQNNKLASRLDSLDSKLSSLNKDTSSNSPPDSISVESFDEFKHTISSQYIELLGSISSLNEKMISEVREQQFTIDELGRKVDLLMSNHKELQYQNQNTPQDSDPTSIIRWILITIVIVVLVLTIFVYRLRHDIKHSKLL